MTLLTALATLALSAAATPTRAQDAETAAAAVVQPPIIIDADRNYYDLRSGVTRFEDDVSITRGAMAVQADRGVIRQADGQITEVELEGEPSTWRDQLEDGSVVTGEARTIHFDVLANVVTLTGNAIIRHAQGEFTGDELVYDLNAESLAGRSTGDERVRVVIEPEALSDPRPSPPASDDPAPEAGDANAADAAPSDSDASAADEAAVDEPGDTDASTEAPTDPPTDPDDG